jgi:hypothetical protein
MDDIQYIIVITIKSYLIYDIVKTTILPTLAAEGTMY